MTAEDRDAQAAEDERRARRVRENEAEKAAYAKCRNVKRPGPFPGRQAIERAMGNP